MEQNATKPFTLKEAEEFVMENQFQIPPDIWADPDYQFQSTDLHCIDDRHEDDGSPIAVPGGPLGIETDQITSIGKMEKIIKRPMRLAREMAITTCEDWMGIPSFHTDEKAEKAGAKIPCQGCGHCNGVFVHPDKYLLDDENLQFLKDYVTDLPKRGAKIAVYKGTHEPARGVFFIDDFTIGLPAKNKSGNKQAFVYNRAWHERINRRLAARIYFLTLIHMEPQVNLRKFQESLVPSITATRLGNTAESLKLDRLPHFRITRDDRKETVVKKIN